jgi:type II secretion system protein C
MKTQILIMILMTLLSGQALAQEGRKNFLVLGVIASNGKNSGVALMKDKGTEKTFAVKQGDEFDKGSKLVSVDRKTIEISVNGIKYSLKVGDETANADMMYGKSSGGMGVASDSIELQGDTVKVTSEYKNHMIKEKLDSVLMQAATVPFVQNGQLRGFTLWDIEPESVFEKFGLKDGDTVTSINDNEIRDLTSTLQLLTSLKGESKASFKFIRNGSEQTLNILVQ